MRSALTMALQEFTGALIVVSHDRHLLRHSVDEYILAHQGKIDEFDGTLDDYHRFISAKNAEDTGIKQKNAAPAKAEKYQADAGVTSGLSKKQLRQQSAEQRKAKSTISNRVKRLEQKIETANTELKQVESQLADTDLYTDERKEELTELIHRQAELKKALEALEENWLELNEELEAG